MARGYGRKCVLRVRGREWASRFRADVALLGKDGEWKTAGGRFGGYEVKGLLVRLPKLKGIKGLWRGKRGEWLAANGVWFKREAWRAAAVWKAKVCATRCRNSRELRSCGEVEVTGGWWPAVCKAGSARAREMLGGASRGFRSRKGECSRPPVWSNEGMDAAVFAVAAAFAAGGGGRSA